MWSASNYRWKSNLKLTLPLVLDTWEEQLKESVGICFFEILVRDSNKTPPRHVLQGGLTWRRHYRKDKLTEADNIAGCDIVISTYNTVSADWGGGQKAAGSVLFSTPWKRIILDEGLLYIYCCHTFFFFC